MAGFKQPPGSDSPVNAPRPNPDQETSSLDATPPPQYTPPFFSPPKSVKDMAYGGINGNGMPSIQAGQIHRLERGYPAFRRGRLLPAIPRTKAETLYARDANQALANPILNTGAAGAATSGTATPGTTNAPNATTKAIVRYRTPYKTNLQ